MKKCGICNKELLVCWDIEGEECCDECFINIVERAKDLVEGVQVECKTCKNIELLNKFDECTSCEKKK